MVNRRALKMLGKVQKFILIFLLGFCIYAYPIPLGITKKAWGLFAIFTSTIFGIILRPIPVSGMAIISLTIAVLFRFINIEQQALIGFSSPTIWLIVSVFCISRGFIKTKLAERIAYYFIFHAGKKTLGLAYSLAGTEILFAPFIPSSTARSGGIMLPVVKSICESFGSRPEDGTEKKIGAYLIQTAFHSNILASAIFLTGMVANPLCQSLARQHGVIFSWIDWFKISCVPGSISLIIMPYLVYKLLPPTRKNSPEAHILAEEHLKSLGPIKRSEITMICIFLIMLLLWIFGDFLNISSVATAFLGLCLGFVTGIITIDDVLGEKDAWNTMIWLSVLIGMSGYLEKFGFISAVTNKIASCIAFLPSGHAFFALTLTYFVFGYFFAGNAAHASALYVGFLHILISTGTKPVIAALTLAYMSSLYSSLTHYGSSAGSIFFGTGYVSSIRWWSIGFIIGFLNFFIWISYIYFFH